jgi:hypothetical protein
MEVVRRSLHLNVAAILPERGRAGKLRHVTLYGFGNVGRLLLIAYPITFSAGRRSRSMPNHSAQTGARKR